MMRCALAFVLLLAQQGCIGKVAAPDGEVTVIDNVTVLDGSGGPALERARVTVRGDRIASLSPARGGAIPAGARVIDGTGKFLLPGFIDMHAHLLFPRCDAGDGPVQFDRRLSERVLAASVRFGITTVRSPATPTIEGLRLRDDLNAGRVRGPRAFAAAELINDPTLEDAALVQLVRDALPLKPDYFKVYARMPPGKTAVIIAAAHRAGVPVIGHLQATTWAEGTALGIDHLVHAVDWSARSLPAARQAAYRDAAQTKRGFLARLEWLQQFDPESVELEPMIAALVRQKVSVDLTLIAYDAKFSPPDQTSYRRDPALTAFPELLDDWTRCGSGAEDWSAADHAKWERLKPKLFAWVRRLDRAGVRLVTGTDLTNPWIAPGSGLHGEFELLVVAGLEPSRVLRMTGADAAAALGRDDLGIIALGRRADLVLLTADPRRDIRSTRKIVWVMQDGTIRHRAEEHRH